MNGGGGGGGGGLVNGNTPDNNVNSFGFFLYLFRLLLCREQMFSFLCCNDVGDAILIVLITLISAGSERTVQ